MKPVPWVCVKNGLSGEGRCCGGRGNERGGEQTGMDGGMNRDGLKGERAGQGHQEARTGKEKNGKGTRTGRDADG